MTPQELKTIRKQLKLSQIKLAELMHVHPMSIYYWEKGRSQIPYTAEVFILNLSSLL